MNTDNFERYLNSFGGQVVRDSRKLLQSAKGSTALGKSIRFKVVPTATGFDTKFYMDDYGTYLDKGVSGTEQKISFKDFKGKTISSPYKYTTKHPPTGILEKWIKRKGLKGRKALKKYRKTDSPKTIKGAGRFITNQSFAFAIAKTIQRYGIKSLSFFQQPLGIGYRKLQKQILKELKLDIQTYLTTFYRPK
jgi:hypothetical protein